MFFCTASASRPWPHASWNITPPLPLASTTGTLPLGAGRAAELGDGALRGLAAHLLDVDTVEQLPAHRRTRSTRTRSACRCRPTATAVTAKRVRTWSSSASSPSLLATRMRRRTSRVVGADLLDRRRRRSGPHSLARFSSSILAAFSTVSGRIAMLLMTGASGVSAPPRAPPPPPARATAPAASAAARRPSSVRLAVWAKPVVSPTTTRIPAPRSRPEVSSSILPSSSRPADTRRSSTNTSAHSPPERNAAPITRWTIDDSSNVPSPPKPPTPLVAAESSILRCRESPRPSTFVRFRGAEHWNDGVGRARRRGGRHRHRDALRECRGTRHAAGRRTGRGRGGSRGRLSAGTWDKQRSGTRIELDHLRPTRSRPPRHRRSGAVAVDRGRLTFNVHVADDDDVAVARGIHRRAVVEPGDVRARSARGAPARPR